MTVVVGKVEMRDAKVEGTRDAGTRDSRIAVAAEVSQAPSDMAGNLRPLRPAWRYCMTS